MVNQKSPGTGTFVVIAIVAFFFLSAFPALTVILGLGALAWYLLYKKGSLSGGTNVMKYTSVFGKLSVLAIVLVVITIIVIRFIVIIPPGKVGVYQLFGSVSTQAYNSGIHFVNPLGTMTEMDTRTQDYTMTITEGEGRVLKPDVISTLTKEGLSVDLDITVLYHLVGDKAPEIYKTIGLDYDEKIIRPTIRSAIREVVALYEAKELYSEKRGEAVQKLVQTMKTTLEPRGFYLEEALLRNVKLPDKLTASIEEKLTADQEAQRMEFVLLKEQQEAERKRIEAAGQRDAQKIINESLSDRYLEYLYINSLKDRLGTIYVPTNPQNGMPLFKSLVP